MKYRFLAAVMGVMLTFSATGTTAVVAQAQTEQSQGEKPDGEPPEKPDGEAPDGGMGGGTPPEKPDGEAPDGMPGGPGGEAPDGMPGEMPDGEGGPGGMPGGQSQGVDSYDAANEYSSDITVSGVSLSSAGADENAALINNGADVTLENVTVNRESEESSGGDNLRVRRRDGDRVGYNDPHTAGSIRRDPCGRRRHPVCQQSGCGDQRSVLRSDPE